MSPYQERVLAEKEELETRLNGLNKFLVGEVIKTLSEAEHLLLVKQAAVMAEYNGILSQRIALFT